MNSLYFPPYYADKQDIETIDKLKNFISQTENNQFQLTNSNGESVSMPKSVTEVFRSVINMMAQGKSISLIPVTEEVTTTQAAQILNISRPYLMKLLKNNEIPYYQVGTHKRIWLQDLVKYKKERDSRRKQGLQKLTQLTQELNLYDISYSEIQAE